MTGGVDLEFIKTAVIVANFFMTVGLALWASLRRPSEVNATRLEALEGHFTDMERKTDSRLDKIEGRLQFIPTVTELGELQADLREVKTKQESFGREIHRVTESLTRIEDFLLSQKAR